MLSQLATAAVAGSVASPHVWRADQMASYQAAMLSSGFEPLDRELPGGGWPAGGLTELLVQQHGVGEMGLLQPALHALARRPIALIQPPHPPQAAAWAADGFPVQRLLWVSSRRAVDACWAAEQVLRNGSCGGLLVWQSQVRTEVLRRLHLAAQASGTFFWLVRPLACAREPSPAPLRLGLSPAAGGINVSFLKRRGPPREGSLFVPLVDIPVSHSASVSVPHANLDRRSPAVASAGNAAPALV